MTKLDGEAGRERGEEGAGGPTVSWEEIPGGFVVRDSTGKILMSASRGSRAVDGGPNDAREWEQCAFAMASMLLRVDDRSASAEPQRAFGPIREAIACAAREEHFGETAKSTEMYSWKELPDHHRDRWLAFADRVLALLGEAPPQAEKSPSPSDLNGAVWIQFLRGGGTNVFRTPEEVAEYSSKNAPCLPYVPARHVTPELHPGATVQPQAHAANEIWVTLENLNRVSLIDIMLEAGRTQGFASKLSAHMLDTFAKAIRKHFYSLLPQEVAIDEFFKSQAQAEGGAE